MNGRARPLAERRSHLIAIGAIAAATLALFGDVLIAGGNRILSAEGQDLSSIFFYWDRFGFGELARGNLALWNPYSFAGAPFVGGFQPALLYPPNWLHLVLPTAQAINVGVALHVFLAGLGVYCWTSQRGLHSAACTLAALVFMFCGAHFLQLYSGHVPHLCTLAWAPFVFLAIDGALRDGSLRWILLGSAVVAMQILAGNIQYVHYTALIAGPYALAGLLTSPRPLRATGALAAIAVGGASLAAVQLLTGMDAVAESLRAGLSYDLASSFPFPPENVLTSVFPGLFGDMVRTPYWGRWALHEESLFVGAAPLLLAVYGAVRGDRRVTRLAVAMALLALLLAFGSYTPLFAFLYDHLPGFRSVRVVARMTFLTSLFVALLVAVGFDRVLKERAPRWLARAALLVGAVATAAGAAVVTDCRRGGRAVWAPLVQSLGFDEETIRTLVMDRVPEACVNAGASLLLGGATLLLLGVLVLAARRSRLFVYAIGIVGVVEVMTYARYTRPTFDPAPLVARSEKLRRLAAAAGLGDARVASEVPYFYLALSAGVHDVWAGADLVLGRYARFIAMTQRWPLDAILVTSGFRHMSPLYGMLRLRDVLRVEGNEVRLVPTGLHELPRARLMSRWRVMPGAEQVLAAMANPAFDPEHEVLLESNPGLVPADGDAPGSVSVSDVSTDELEVWADVPGPAILLVTDNYSAGWKATPLPGSSAASYRVLPADYTLRAIPLPPGTHHFRLEYRPTGFVIGTWVTILSLAVWGGLAGHLWRTRSRAASATPRHPPR